MYEAKSTFCFRDTANADTVFANNEAEKPTVTLRFIEARSQQ
jgi:hypothetical protein